MFLDESLNNKWKAVLDHPDLQPIADPHKRAVTAIMLENMERELGGVSRMAPGSQRLFETDGVSADGIPVNFMGASSSTQGAGGIDTFDPVLISLVRRSLPNLISYDIAGVQPMTGPTGLVFALRSRYTNSTTNNFNGAETFYNEVDTTFSSITSGLNVFGQKFVGTLPGNTTSIGNVAANGVYNTGSAMSTAQAEALGTVGNSAFPQMAFSIEKVQVTAGSRALKAAYTLELAQDIKAIHGLNAEDELSNILQSEILAEINREFVRTINFTAKIGAQVDTATAGRFDLDIDANGRWSVEKFKGMIFFIERECNQISKETRRGKGNIMLCSSDVASALNAAGQLSYTPKLADNLVVDDTGNTFAGVLNGRIKVYIDPYSSGGNYVTLGFRGGPMDAGIFYCPYVPLQMVRAIEPESFTPRIGFKTRYGVVANPFAEGLTQGLGVIHKDSNVYYRKVLIDHIM
jgi:hypothetical protein